MGFDVGGERCFVVKNVMRESVGRVVRGNVKDGLGSCNYVSLI